MTLAGLREVFATVETAYDLPRDCFESEEDLGPCPCFVLAVPGFRADGYCWRCSCDYHPYSARKSDGRCCVHVTGDPDLAERLRDLLDAMNWYGGWALELETASTSFESVNP